MPLTWARAGDELAVVVFDAQVFLVAHIDQAVVAAPAVGVDDRVEADMPADGLLQGLFLTIGDDLGVDAAVAFENAEHDGLATGADAGRCRWWNARSGS